MPWLHEATWMGRPHFDGSSYNKSRFPEAFVLALHMVPFVRFSPKKWRCYLFKEALKWLVSFLEVVRFYNINHFLCSKIFSWAFGFGSTHGGFTCDYHLKNVNLKTWIIHEQLGLGIGWIHFWDPITPRILKITLILLGT